MKLLLLFLERIGALFDHALHPIAVFHGVPTQQLE
jgi:hypothetical protein